MTLTRWKVMAGTLGLSLGGLAAFAEPPAEPAVRKSSVPVPPAPVSIPVPAVAELPVVPPLSSTPTPSLPISTLPDTTPAMCPKASDVCELPVAALAPVVSPAAEPLPVPSPQLVDVPVPEPTLPTFQLTAATADVPATPLSALPTPTNPVAPPVQQVAAPVAAPAAPAVAVADKKLRVLLSMGEDRPRFEVKDTEETLLRLVSDKVDVKCPSDRGESLPTMKAVGAVAFYTPGGEGVCDELILTPGTGQVVVTGNVRFKYHWGKVETEVSGERMTFRLGAGPGVAAVDRSSAPVVPVSYQSVP